MHIVDMVYFWARTKPLHPAVIEPAGIITYVNLAHAIETAAQHLTQAITNRSKPVAISINNSPKMLVALFGLLRAGFSVVLANPTVFKHLAAAGASTLVYERNTATMDGLANVQFDDRWINFGASADKTNAPLPQSRMEGGNIICFTSGTTGRPKVVVCPQSSWQQRVLFPLNSTFAHYERMLIVPPLTTSWGLSRAYEVLHSGRTICLAPPGQPTLWMASTYDVDAILASPQQALELAELQETDTHFQLAALKSFHIGAAAISRTGVQRVKNALCRNIVIFYGSTEAGVAALAPYDMIADVPGAVGYVMPGVEVEIVDASERVLPIGKEGFVRVRSKIFAENMAASRSPDQWFYPGDLGLLTENNMLRIAGRGTDVVNRGGDKIALTDLEDFLLSCFGVKDAGSCTVLGPRGFSEVWVGLVLGPSADIAALRLAIESNAQFKNNIDKIFVIEAIPRGSLGKVQRDELKKILQLIAEEQGGAI